MQPINLCNQLLKRKKKWNVYLTIHWWMNSGRLQICIATLGLKTSVWPCLLTYHFCDLPVSLAPFLYGCSVDNQVQSAFLQGGLQCTTNMATNCRWKELCKPLALRTYTNFHCFTGILSGHGLWNGQNLLPAPSIIKDCKFWNFSCIPLNLITKAFVSLLSVPEK